MDKKVISITVLFLLLAGCGCIARSGDTYPANATAFAEKVNASRPYYDDLVRSDPDNSTAWLIRGMYYNNAFGQYDEALRSYNRSLELKPDYGLAWYAKGITLQNLRRFNESEKCFENARNYGFQEKTGS